MVESKRKTGIVVAGLMLGILMAAMDNTIVATAMGTIVAELGGLDKFIWVTSAYMVASMAGMPIFGKLSDMYGRKRFFIFGLVVFLLGSMLCGTATSIIQLSVYRAIQGIGGGSLMPICFTIVFDIFGPEKRGRMMGLLGAVFGTSSIFGPLLGSYITEYINWKWVFYINLPIGIVSLILVAVGYRESFEYREQKIDWWGAITLVASVVSLMFALELGGNQHAWNSAVIIGLFTIFVTFCAAFFLIERKASDPIISFSLFKNRLSAASYAAAFFYGATYITAVIYIPIFLQGVKASSVTNSGLLLTPMMLGSVVGSQMGGQLITRTSYRNIMSASGVLLVLGAALLSSISPETSRAIITFYMIVLGFGVGFHFSVLSTSSIHGVEMRRRGTATSTNIFLRSLGMTLGITIFGIIQRNYFTRQLTKEFPATDQIPHIGDPRAILSPETRSLIPAPVLEKITSALSQSISYTFMWTLVAAVLALISVLFMGNERVHVKRERVSKEKKAT